ncbi:hypothetical protein G6R29_01755 [Fructobacillus sp. M2-14]|uniref:Uncharacterized protein n=1 Tax=Fructobacillus broussonetiae TaxID=2713173 RepID=A0ABS5R0D6_9LACO|nr:hypothetical protein [Fructobacillus broussonetiae]MBS9338360.1 hypothetical protein [Fructobacillus broussonetiae]
MLTKNAELLLKKFINNEFDSFDSSNVHISEGEIFRKSPLHNEAETETALSELLNNGYVSTIAKALYYPTTSGKTYFDLKKITNKNKIIWNIGVPALLGFIGGSLPNIFNWLARLIKWLIQLQ